MAVMKLEATNTVSCDVDIDKIIKDYGIDRFTKYYELQKIALRVLHSNYSINSDSIGSLATQLVSQLGIKLKLMKDAPITVKDLQYAIDNKKYIDFAGSSYEVARAEIADTSLIENQVIISTRFVLNKVDQKTVAEIEKAYNMPYFDQIIDYSTPYAYLASIEEVEVPSNIAQADNYSQAESHTSKLAQTSSKKESKKSPKTTKSKQEIQSIPEESDDYDPFGSILNQKR